MVGINPQDNSNQIARYQELYLRKLAKKESVKKDPKVEKSKSDILSKSEIKEKSTTFEELYKKINNKQTTDSKKENIDLNLFNVNVQTRNKRSNMKDI